MTLSACSQSYAQNSDLFHYYCSFEASFLLGVSFVAVVATFYVAAVAAEGSDNAAMTLAAGEEGEDDFSHLSSIPKMGFPETVNFLIPELYCQKSLFAETADVFGDGCLF